MKELVGYLAVCLGGGSAFYGLWLLHPGLFFLVVGLLVCSAGLTVVDI